MKAKIYFLGFILLSLFCFNSIIIASAIDYSLGISIGDEYAWAVKDVKESDMENAIGADWEDYIPFSTKTGEKMKIRIVNIDVGVPNVSWQVTYDKWEYTENEFNTEPNIEDMIYSIPMNPGSMLFDDLIICPIPVADYLSEFAGSYSNFSSLGNTLSINFVDTSIEYRITYDTNTGVISSLIIKISGIYVYEFSRVVEIDYTLEILTIVLGVSIVAIIIVSISTYLYLKKKKRRHQRTASMEPLPIAKAKKGLLIFISYATQDGDLFKIREIVKGLSQYENIGDIVYCEENTRDNFVKYMNENVSKCDVMILFCSPNSLNSRFVEEEWTASLAIGKPIIPLFFKTEHIPGLLRARVGVEFDAFNPQKSIKELYTLILKNIKK